MHIIADVNTISKTAQRNLTFNLVCNFLIQLFPLKSLVFVVHFLNAFWHGKEIFSKSSSQNQMVPLLIVLHLPYSKYKGVKICFHPCLYKIKIFHSCRTRVVRVALVLHSCRQCCTRVALVLLVSHLCRNRVASVALVLHSCRSCRSCLTLVL